MRSSVFEAPYGKSTKYQKQQYNSDQEMSEEYMKTFVNSIRQQVSRNQSMYKQSGNKSSSKKKSKKQPNSDDERFPWQDRYKGKSKQKEMSEKYISQKEKLRTQQKSIQYDKIFEDLCYGNSTDVVSAALIYKDILESIALYIMEKQLEMDIIFAKKKPGDIPKLPKQQLTIEKKKAVKEQKPRKQDKNKQKTQTKTQELNNQLLQIPDSQLQQSIEVPLKQNYQQKEYTKTKSQNSQKKVRPFQQEEYFLQDFGKFKRCSSPNGIISIIPYKSIPSLFLISLLNFIISKTAQHIVVKYFDPQDPLQKIYKELNTISQFSKKYFIEEKLTKGLRYITEVEDKLNKIYIKKGFKPKNTSNTLVKHENILTESGKQDTVTQCQERKSSTRSEESPILEQRKQQTQKLTSKQK